VFAVLRNGTRSLAPGPQDTSSSAGSSSGSATQ
jgi:hypothetical protein